MEGVAGVAADGEVEVAVVVGGLHREGVERPGAPRVTNVAAHNVLRAGLVVVRLPGRVLGAGLC